MSYQTWQQPSAVAGPSRPHANANIDPTRTAYSVPTTTGPTPDASPSPSPAAAGSSGPHQLQGVFAQGPLVEPHQDLNDFLEGFWTRQMEAIERDTPDFRTYPLPLARIKKVMKSDEVVKMISAEAPIMFSKACEIFISELTCRAWLIAESNKRRTLQKSDVAAAIALSDMFDFLIDIVPRDDGGVGGAQETDVDVGEVEGNGEAEEEGEDGAAEIGEGTAEDDFEKYIQEG